MVLSPVSQGSYALPCRDCTGPKPFRLFSPYLAGFARRPCHPALRECFRVSQNLVKRPPLADERELATTDLFVKYTAHSRSAAPFPPYVPYCRLRAFEARAMNTKPLALAHTQPT